MMTYLMFDSKTNVTKQMVYKSVCELVKNWLEKARSV